MSGAWSCGHDREDHCSKMSKRKTMFMAMAKVLRDDVDAALNAMLPLLLPLLLQLLPPQPPLLLQSLSLSPSLLLLLPCFYGQCR